MVRNFVDNTFAWNGNEALDFIRKFFSENLSDFKEEDSDLGDRYVGFKVEFKSKDVIIKFSNPKGELNYEIFINGKQYSLLSYDERMKEVYVCSKINLELTLSILLKFLTEKTKF